MTSRIVPINIVVEDELSRAVALRMLDSAKGTYQVGHTYIGHGVGYIKTRIQGYNRAAQRTPWLVLTDLDMSECPAVLVQEILGGAGKSPNLLLRVAVREVEAWLLADRGNFAKFTGIRAGLLPKAVEFIEDPKRHLIQIVGKSRFRAIREDIVPRPKSTARQGPNYNGRLIEFVAQHWSPQAAAAAAPSLAASLRCLQRFEPQYRRRR